MRKIALLLIMWSVSLAFGQTKRVTDSEIKWWGYKVAKIEATSHYGVLNVKEGKVVLRKKQLIGGSFVLDMTSIKATDLSGENQEKLNAHLKNGDFFDVEKYPTAVFKITDLKKTGKTDKQAYNYWVTGDLTVKDITQSISFPARISVAKGIVMLSSGKFSIDRQHWGIAYQSAMKDMVIKDDIDLQVSFTAR